MNLVRPIFIVGMPRSGTTLLRSLLNQHPRIAIAPETHFVFYSVDKRKTPDLCWQEYAITERFGSLGIKAADVSSRLNQKSKVSYKGIFDAILQEYAYCRGKSLCGEKTPGHYEHLETLFKWYPEACVVWMVRDPRGVSASYQLVPWYNGGVIGPALRWRSSIRKLRKWKGDRRVLVVKYEDVVLDARRSMEAICEFLGVELMPVERILARRKEPDLERFYKWEKDQLEAAAGELTNAPLSKWKQQLAAGEKILVECIARVGMRQMNYDASTKLTLFDYISAYLSVIQFVLQRPDIILHKLLNFKSRAFFLRAIHFENSPVEMVGKERIEGNFEKRNA